MAPLKVRDLTCCGTSLYTPATEVFLHSIIFLGLNVLVNYVSKLYLSARNVHTVFGDGLGYEFPLFDSVTDCVSSHAPPEPPLNPSGWRRAGLARDALTPPSTDAILRVRSRSVRSRCCY